VNWTRIQSDKDIFWTAARSKAWVCGRSLAGNVGSNPACSMNVFILWVVCVAGNGLCVGLITRSVESYRVWCV